MANPITPTRKRIRLPADAYTESGSSWVVTIGTVDRRPVFADVPLGRAVAATIHDRCTKRGVILEAYCLMPDHAHLLLQITDSGIGLVDMVRDLKSCSTRAWWSHGGTGMLWQRRFYDRGIRTMADYDRAVDYILENPVRAGLVNDWEDYPLKGGRFLEGD